MNAVLAFLFENSPYTPFLSAWLVGFCAIGEDGLIYRTVAGQRYLDKLDADLASQAVPA